MFFTLSDIIIYAKRAKNTPRAISEELRGWKWSDPPVLPPSSSFIGVSDITGGLCPNGRIIYLRYVEGVREPSSPELGRGSIIHSAYSKGIENVKKLILNGETRGDRIRTAMADDLPILLKEISRFSNVPNYQEVAKLIWNHVSDVYSVEVDKVRGKSPFLSRDSLVSLVVPFYVEFPIDGSLLGLSSNLRADAFIPQIPIIAEMKTRKPKEVYSLTLAGYALAYESVYEVPIDFGLLCYVRVDEQSSIVQPKCDFKVINDRLRQDFLEERDRRLEIKERGVDPGLPKYCEADCPFLTTCGGRVK
ncbi:type I-A CRISPR-associated protein Cas4/Csa1 [Acidianus sp. RZ1]|uniref:type I-A CRISPR-associated protein Cas4/Csa1 n=1 Tax=Acidianus sp. RZ1 TaxID=1540082 RepID=UPI001492DC6C|nr:type I-A CRISPR-associated protein Cas4/Csa1 [Acidianus sp. RZ1]NON61646.1 type I-A CRISPR-associated protein Cas4/Csa1 [Acidianus sp. RZ1]